MPVIHKSWLDNVFKYQFAYGSKKGVDLRIKSYYQTLQLVKLKKIFT
ncbi:unnamed protein product [Commensalibacter communis]|nr:unnamed protein product [Commensalibacter communis]